jgi:4-hydroxybenzoate polyprenyltransferase
LPLLLLGVSLLYTGGMFLNDAFDEEFDRLRRPERPIPSGKISAGRVWQFGFGQLLVGIIVLFCCGKTAGVIGVILAFFIVVYDFTHKFFVESPWLMGACRFWVYIIAAAMGVDGLNGFAVFGGVALAAYVVGISYIARRESSRGTVPYWPLPLLAAPVILALTINAGDYRLPAIWISLLLGLWVVRYVHYLLLGGTNVGWIVSNLLAGIILVDWLAVAPQIPHLLGTMVFLPLFGLAKWFQKFVPAT